MKKTPIMIGTILVASAPIIAVASCNQEKTEVLNYSDFNAAYHDLWYEFKRLNNKGNSIMAYNKSYKVNIKNQKNSVTFLIHKGNTRDSVMKVLDDILIQISQKHTNHISILTLINEQYLWNMAVLSRMDKNTKYDINDNSNVRFPEIIASKITKIVGSLLFTLSFELSDGTIIKNDYHMHTGFKLKKNDKSSTKLKYFFMNKKTHKQNFNLRWSDNQKHLN